MNDEKNKNLTWILLIITALLLIPILCFSGGGKGISTGLIFEDCSNDEQPERTDNRIVATVDKGKDINKIYLFINNVEKTENNNSMFIKVNWGNSDTDKTPKDDHYYISEKKYYLPIPENGISGWVCLNEEVCSDKDKNLNINSKYIKISWSKGFELKEIAFTHVDEKTKKESQIKIKGCECVIGNEEVSAKDAKKVCDEQDSFILSGVYAMSDRENKLSCAVADLLNGNGGYVSEYENILGVELAALGVLIFGNNSFGLRFIPFLFFAASVILIFFFGKNLFKSPWGGFISSIAFMLAGLPLSAMLKGSLITISAFLALASYYFAFIFYERTSGGKNVVPSLIYVILSGLMLSLAIAVNVQALTAVFGLLVFAIVPIVKGIVIRKRNYKEESGLEKEYARERYVSIVVRSIFAILIAFVILPLLLPMFFYLFGYNSYCGYYGTENLFKIMVINNSRIIQNAQTGIFPSWLIGMGGEKMFNAAGDAVFLAANVGLTVISLLSFIPLCIIYFMSYGENIKNADLKCGISAVKMETEFIIITFLSQFLMLAVFGIANSYLNFTYSLTFLILSPIMLLKLVKTSNRKLFITLSVIFGIIVGVFFAFEFPFIYNLPLGDRVAPFFNWLLKLA